LRVLLAGSLIAVAVIIARITGTFVGGFFSSFPVIVVSTLIILDHKRGKNLMIATAKAMPYGSLGTVAFLVAFHWLVPDFGLLGGIITSYIISIIFAGAALQIRLKVLKGMLSIPGLTPPA